MTRHKRTTHVLSQPPSAKEIANFWTNEFKKDFDPNRKKLLTTYPVPRIKVFNYKETL